MSICLKLLKVILDLLNLPKQQWEASFPGWYYSCHLSISYTWLLNRTWSVLKVCTQNTWSVLHWINYFSLEHNLLFFFLQILLYRFFYIFIQLVNYYLECKVFKSLTILASRGCIPFKAVWLDTNLATCLDRPHHHLCYIPLCFILSHVLLSLHKSDLQASLCHSNLTEPLLPHKEMSHSGLSKALKTIPSQGLYSINFFLNLPVNLVNTIQYALVNLISNTTFLVPNYLSYNCHSPIVFHFSFDEDFKKW